MTDTPLSDDVVETAGQALQDHMEQFHGVSLKASEWDAAARAALEAARYGELERYLNESRPYLEAFRLKADGASAGG